MAKQADFDKFLSNIEPSTTTVSYISSIQTNLRKYLKEHEQYKEILIDTFLSGSYAKHTSIRPVVGDKKRDVDIIVVTNYSSSKSSTEVLEELKKVLVENDKYKTAEIQNHSIGVEMGGISIDVVPVIVDEDDEELYYVGDKESGEWTCTDPKGHKTWSTNVNKDNNNEYKPLVKIMKWWRRFNCPEDKKFPKGITLEKIVADNLGDSSLSTEDYLLGTIQNIISTYKEDYVDKGKNPYIADPSEKIENNDLLSGYSTEEFSEFIEKLEEHANMLNDKGTTNDVWREILGVEFPKSKEERNSMSLSGFQLCIKASHKQKPRWPMQRDGAVFISLRVINRFGEIIEYINNDEPLEKGCKLYFSSFTGVRPPYRVVWQIVNTGDEAESATCLRGDFEESDYGKFGKYEETAYSGVHSVQCFVIKQGICVARSKEFIINIR